MNSEAKYNTYWSKTATPYMVWRDKFVRENTRRPNEVPLMAVASNLFPVEQCGVGEDFLQWMTDHRNYVRAVQSFGQSDPYEVVH